MDLDEAWKFFGRDPARVMATLLSLPDLESRVLAAERALSKARKQAKSMMASLHPDKNPGDMSAHTKYLEVQRALASIEKSTEALRRKYEDLERRKSEERPGMISVRS